MPAPRATAASRLGASSSSSARRLCVLPLGLLALAASSTRRFGLHCFTPSIPDRSVGHAAGRASTAHGKFGRVTLHEAMDYKSAPSLTLNSQASPKVRLLRSLLAGGGRSSSAGDVQKLVAELVGEECSGGADAASVFGGTWHLLSSALSDSSIPAPQLEIYRGGNFLHDGSIQNGGLFKAILQRQVAEVNLGVPQVTFSEDRMEVSAQAEVAPGRERTLSYSAQLRSLSPTTFHRKLTSLDLPEPVGSLTPLIETTDIIEVAYFDEDLLILRDEKGHTEILVHESTEALVLRSKSGEIVGLSEILVDSPVLALSR